MAHPWRRRAAAIALSACGPARQVLVLCQGNVCRSPYAARVLARQIADARGDGRIEVTSAGFMGPDRASPALAITEAARRGIDLSGHRSRLLTRELLDAADVILVMNVVHFRAVTARRAALRGRVLILGDFDPRSIRRREIFDPWGSPREAFEESYDRIDRCVREFLRHLAE